MWIFLCVKDSSKAELEISVQKCNNSACHTSPACILQFSEFSRQRSLGPKLYVIRWHEWRIISRRHNRKNSVCELPDIGFLTGVEMVVVVVVVADVIVL